MYFQNPYIAGNPVGDTPSFVGRSDVLREVLRVLHHAQNNAIVLYGQRRIGKTSVLQALQTQLPKQGTYQPVFFDLQDKAKWPLERVLRELARTISHALGQAAPDLGHSPEINFRQVWLPQLLQTLYADAPLAHPETSLVILFDEFDVLAEPEAEQAGAALFPYLRELLMIDSNCLNFVFVIGRNIDDLTNIALSLFKATPSKRVSLLSREDTIDLIRLAESNQSLQWSDIVVETVWQLTCGHPFLTQHLCQNIWENLHDEVLESPPKVQLRDVEAAIPDILDASRNTLEWLWDGLPPAERVVASALAEAGAGIITETQLEHLLYESGVRVVIRELQNAPQLLQDWDLIEPAEGGYRFRVELLRRWIAKYKPLHRVQDELDRVEPVADNLYKASLGLYRSSQLEAALPIMRQAVALNPNHVGANQLLADILLAQSQPLEAHDILERLYQYQPAAARHRLIQALLALTQLNEDKNEKLKWYEEILELDADQPEAKSGWQAIWQLRGDNAYQAGDLETALAIYQKIDLDDKVAEIQKKLRNHEFEMRLHRLKETEQAEQYNKALEQVQYLAQEFADKRDWTNDLERLQQKTHLIQWYQEAKRSLENNDRETAQNLLVQVITLEPKYEEATLYLHWAVTGAKVNQKIQQCTKELTHCHKHEAELIQQLEQEKTTLQQAETLINIKEQTNQKHAQQIEILEKKVALLMSQLENQTTNNPTIEEDILPNQTREVKVLNSIPLQKLLDEIREDNKGKISEYDHLVYHLFSFIKTRLIIRFEKIYLKRGEKENLLFQLEPLLIEIVKIVIDFFKITHFRMKIMKWGNIFIISALISVILFMLSKTCNVFFEGNTICHMINHYFL